MHTAMLRRTDDRLQTYEGKGEIARLRNIRKVDPYQGIEDVGLPRFHGVPVRCDRKLSSDIVTAEEQRSGSRY